jgi:hypothetical protein
MCCQHGFLTHTNVADDLGLVISIRLVSIFLQVSFFNVDKVKSRVRKTKGILSLYSFIGILYYEYLFIG